MRKLRSLAAVAVLLTAIPAAFGADYLDKDKQNREYAEPTEDTAVIYFVHNTSVAMAIKFWAFAEDEFVGVTRGKSYFYARVPAGRHLLWAKAENVSMLELEVEAGKTYFVRQNVGLGIGKARVKLVELDEAKGRKLIRKLPFARPTDDGRARGLEIATKRDERVRARQARKSG